MIAQPAPFPADFRPMLSAKVEDYPVKKPWIPAEGEPNDPAWQALMQMHHDGVFPMYCSPKYDGIRVIIHPILGPVTRTLKQIPNLYIRKMLLENKALHGLDGEILCGEVTSSQVFNQTQSTVMTGSPEDFVTPFTFVAFDSLNTWMLPYGQRLEEVQKCLQQSDLLDTHPNTFKAAPTFIAYDVSSIMAYEDTCLEHGYEGIMLRSHTHSLRYKFNRSTAKQGFLLKMKRMEDAEGIILDAEEMLHNMNPATTDALGFTKRTTHQENKVESEMLGKLKVRIVTGKFAGKTCFIGSGFTHDERTAFWKLYQHDINGGVSPEDSPGELLGHTVCFKYQPHGSKDRPRIPIWKGFRND